MKIINKNLAFTLAEVLITLGIIGVVAALTIPIINQNIQTEKFRSSIKKEYSTLNQAIKMLIANNGDLDLSSANNFITDLSTSMKIIKNGTWDSITTLPPTYYYHCYKESSGNCGSVFYRPGQNTLRAFVSPSGAFFFVMPTSPNCSHSDYHSHGTSEPNPKNNQCAQFYIDVNGDSPPNQFGVDMHLFKLLKDNNQYYLRPPTLGVVNCAKNSPENFNTSFGCTPLMLYDRKMP